MLGSARAIVDVGLIVREDGHDLSVGRTALQTRVWWEVGESVEEINDLLQLLAGDHGIVRFPQARDLVLARWVNLLALERADEGLENSRHFRLRRREFLRRLEEEG